MKITDIRTFLMQAGAPPDKAWASDGRGVQNTSRNWLFVKIYTDEGITGVGECSGWPRVVETAVLDLKSVLVGEDPAHIERLWQKLHVARSEEHTSELQSLMRTSYAVFCLQKKKSMT